MKKNMRNKAKHFSEDIIEEAVNTAFRHVLSEMANNNLTLREFTADMKNMGFVYREGTGSSRVYYIPQYSGSEITVHAHNDNSTLDGNVLRQVKIVLNGIGWFKDPTNFAKFPFDKWQLPNSDVNVDTTQQEIETANKEYENAEVTPVFPVKSSVCVLKTPYGVNLCRNSNDRRPLLSSWFNEFGYDRETNTKPCLKRDNWEKVRTEVFPINQDGTLDKMIIENKKYGKNRIK